jgi:O-antigen/teichoic acid export membrane protein
MKLFLRGNLKRHLSSDIIKSLKWQYFLNIGLGIIGATYLLLLSQILGSESFGIYTLCAAIPAVSVALFDYRLQEFVLYIKENSRIADFPKTLSAILWLDLLSKIAFSLLSVSAFYFMKMLGYKDIYLDIVILCTALIFVGKMFSGPAMGTLRSCGKLEYFSFAQVADWTLRLAALICLYANDLVSISSALWSQIFIAAIFNALIVRRAAIEVGLSLDDFFTKSNRLSSLLSSNSHLIIANQGISASDSVVKELDVVISGIFLTAPQIAAYKVAKSLAAIAWRLADPVFIVIMPKMAKLNAAGHSAELSAFVKALTLILLPVAIALFGASVVGVMLMGPYLVGPDYVQAISLYPLASAWILVALPLIWTHSLAAACGRPAIFFVGGGIGNAIGLGAIFFGAWLYGINGALAGLSVAFALPFALSFLLLRRAGVFTWARPSAGSSAGES